MIGPCKYCGTVRRLHRDHIQPKSLGGSDETSNIQHICANCHEDKTVSQATLVQKTVMNRPEVKEKLRLRARGRTPWNKGKIGVYSEEAIAKMSRSHLGRPSWIKGKHHTSATVEKIREAGVGRKASLQTKRKMSASHMGHIVSDKTKKKISIANKGNIPWSAGKKRPEHSQLMIWLWAERHAGQSEAYVEKEQEDE